MAALKIAPWFYFTVLVLLLVCVQNGAVAYTCYLCTGPVDPTCEDATSKVTKTCPTGCKTQWIRNKGNNVMDFVSRGCTNANDKQGCTDTGGNRENCFYLCKDDLCNTDVYTPPTIIPGTTTTGYPEHCFECSYVPGEAINSHCLRVNSQTRISNKGCAKGCKTHVRFSRKDHSIVSDMTRSCNIGTDVKSFCRESGDDYNCYTFCIGHMCNHDDYDVIPEDPDNGGNGDGGNGSGRMGTTQSSSFYALTIVLLVSLLLTL